MRRALWVAGRRSGKTASTTTPLISATLPTFASVAVSDLVLLDAPGSPRGRSSAAAGAAADVGCGRRRAPMPQAPRRGGSNVDRRDGGRRLRGHGRKIGDLGVGAVGKGVSPPEPTSPPTTHAGSRGADDRRNGEAPASMRPGRPWVPGRAERDRRSAASGGWACRGLGRRRERVTLAAARRVPPQSSRSSSDSSPSSRSETFPSAAAAALPIRVCRCRPALCLTMAKAVELEALRPGRRRSRAADRQTEPEPPAVGLSQSHAARRETRHRHTGGVVERSDLVRDVGRLVGHRVQRTVQARTVLVTRPLWEPHRAGRPDRAGTSTRPAAPVRPGRARALAAAVLQVVGLAIDEPRLQAAGWNEQPGGGSTGDGTSP